MSLPVALAAGVTCGIVVTALSVEALRRRAVLDVPNQRSSHSTPTVRGGGVGLIAGCLMTVAASSALASGRAWLFVLGIGCLSFAAVGFFDDVKGSLPALHRLAVQVLIAACAVEATFDELPHDPYVAVLVAAGSVIWIVSYVNAFNFMDGIDGISVVQAVVAGSAITVAAYQRHDYPLEVVSASLVAGAAGFAPFNVPRARAFLGDVGSYFAGAWIAGLVLAGIHFGLPPEVVLAPLVLYAADTSVTLLRRVLRGDTWYEAHREHVYQQLVDLGWSHTATSALVLAVTATCSVLGFVSFTSQVTWRALADGAIVLLVAGYLLSPVAVGRFRPGLDRRES